MDNHVLGPQVTVCIKQIYQAYVEGRGFIDIDQDVIVMIKALANKKVIAVKLVRRIFNIGLAEAKAICDYFWKEEQA